MATRIELPKFQAFDANGDPLSGGLVYTYIAGTDTLKATYTDRAAGTENANPVVLDSRGEAVIYGDGSYKFVLKDSAEATIWTFDNIRGINENSLTTIGDYSGDFNAAITDIGATETTLVVDSASTMSGVVTVPTTCSVRVEKGGSIDQSTYALTFNGPFECGPFQAFTGTGTVSFGDNVHEILVEWMGNIDGTADDVQINAAITSASNNQKIKAYAPAYTCSSSIALNKSCTLELGTTIITSTADPAVQITANDVVLRGINRKESQIKNTTATENVIRSVGATRSGITIENLYLEGAGSSYVAQDRESENLIWFGDNPDAGTHSNIVIRDCYLTESLNGILFQFTDDSQIINNTFLNTNNGLRQLNLWSCDRILIEGNTFIDSGGMVNAIEFAHYTDDPCTRCEIIGNTFSGIYTPEVINLTGNKHIVSKNQIKSTGAGNAQGIQLLQASTDTAIVNYENIISENQIELTNAAAAYGIGLKDDGGDFGVKRNIICNNKINHGGAGPGIAQTGTGVNDNLIEGNIILGTGVGAAQDGIYFDSGSTGNTIRNNYISGVGRTGIWGNSAERLTLVGNEVTGSAGVGIQITNGDDHIINYNRVHSNTSHGMDNSSTTKLSFLGNVGHDNGGVQIYNTIDTLANDATPSVASGGPSWLTGGTTTITDFDDGYSGQIITIISEHAITITDGTNIFLNGSANFVMAATDTLTLICKDDLKWYEISRSDNT